jgi:hypothetical protein
MSKKRRKGAGSRGRKGNDEPRLSGPVVVTKQLAADQPSTQLLSCCGGASGGGSSGGGGASGSYIVRGGPDGVRVEVTTSRTLVPDRTDYVSVEKAIGRLFRSSPHVIGPTMYLQLADGRRVQIEPKGVFRILRSADDKYPVRARKAIRAVMLLKEWTFEQALGWMRKEFGDTAAQNSAHEYVDSSFLGDPQSGI